MRLKLVALAPFLFAAAFAGCSGGGGGSVRRLRRGDGADGDVSIWSRDAVHRSILLAPGSIGT